MKPLAAFFTVAVLLAASDALASGCGGHPVLSTTREDGTSIGLVISGEQMAETPVWLPEEGEPPLPLSHAARIALEWAEGVYTRYDSVHIHSINLRSYGCWSSRGPDLRSRWYYVFNFAPVIDGNSVFGGGNFAAVLMDGTVIGPETVDRDRP
ncbi:MAG: hypothetical protein HKM95_00240 [Inquilinus sp.]|nr:hypothetical protein [Inquilinus sp.]